MKVSKKATISIISGANLGIRFNAETLKGTNFEKGDKVNVEYSNKKIIITPCKGE